MTKRPQQQLCAVVIGLDHYILPMADGLKLVDIMAKAVRAERNYGRWDSGRKKWSLLPHSELGVDAIGLELVRPNEIEMPDEVTARVKRLALPGAAS